MVARGRGVVFQATARVRPYNTTDGLSCIVRAYPCGRPGKMPVIHRVAGIYCLCCA